jgi:hypothetical protein
LPRSSAQYSDAGAAIAKSTSIRLGASERSDAIQTTDHNKAVKPDFSSPEHGERASYDEGTLEPIC